MKILEYLFLIGVCFTIFEFIWGIFKLIFNLLTSSFNSPAKSNLVRIVKYVLFISATIHFIQTINVDQSLVSSSIAATIISTLVLGLYLLGKYQNRLVTSQIKNITNQFINGASNQFDSKLEKFLILGGIALFVIGSFFPSFFDNGITQWFTDSILNIYNTPFFGFIFKVIAFFVLVGTFTRGSRILGKLINGESFSKATQQSGNVLGNFGGNAFNRSAFNNNKPEEPEFTEYEDVTDE